MKTDNIFRFAPRDIKDRFVSKIRFTNFCWVWSGTTGSGKSGLFKIKGRKVSAGKLAYKWSQPDQDAPYGPIKRLCGNSLCVNPKHLEET